MNPHPFSLAPVSGIVVVVHMRVCLCTHTWMHLSSSDRRTDGRWMASARRRKGRGTPSKRENECFRYVVSLSAYVAHAVDDDAVAFASPLARPRSLVSSSAQLLSRSSGPVQCPNVQRSTTITVSPAMLFVCNTCTTIHTHERAH